MELADIIPLRRGKVCQFGASVGTCKKAAVTRRRRPNHAEVWDVCERHAAFLDRLRVNMDKHKVVLNRLSLL